MESSFILQLRHATYKYNLIISADGVLLDEYFLKLTAGLKQASMVLYDATDGQVMLNKIAVYDDKHSRSSADLRLHVGDGRFGAALLTGIDNASTFLAGC
jgi:hypothetical protein